MINTVDAPEKPEGISTGTHTFNLLNTITRDEIIRKSSKFSVMKIDPE